MEKIETQEKLDEALSSERAVVMIHAQWASQSYQSFHKLKNWIQEWNAFKPHLAFESYWIDIDHKSIREWFDSIAQPNGKLGHDAELERFKRGFMGGGGPFMWIKSGEIVGFELNAYAVGGVVYLTRRAQEIYNA